MAVRESRFEADFSLFRGEWQGPLTRKSGKSDQSRLFRTTAWMQEVGQCRSNCRVDQRQVRQAASPKNKPRGSTRGLFLQQSNGVPITVPEPRLPAGPSGPAPA